MMQPLFRLSKEQIDAFILDNQQSFHMRNGRLSRKVLQPLGREHAQEFEQPSGPSLLPAVV